MIEAIFKIVLAIILLIILHELGHIIAAAILKLKIKMIGFSIQPIPHIYVSVNNTTSFIRKILYLFSGSSTTILIFIIFLTHGFFGYTYLYWAFVIQLIIEFNPFYSDFTIFFIYHTNHSEKKISTYLPESYIENFKNYIFSLYWYIHFVMWIFMIILLFKIKNHVI